MSEHIDRALARYDAAAQAAAAQIIARYSTSFSLATRLLRGTIRTDIRNLYAMVRIADEIVDSGLPTAEATAALDAYEAQVRAAPTQRFHADPVLHAYALSARRCGFHDAHVTSFFASMRRDLTQQRHNVVSFTSYVYGSAEVIGLLCLDAFLAGKPHPRRAEMEAGARRLGAAFQKINFLRDLREDRDELGRTYLPSLTGSRMLGDAPKAALIADIRADLDAAAGAIELLPRSSRFGVAAATALFTELTDRLDALPAAEIYTARVSVPAPRKASIVARAAAGSLRL